MVRRMTIEEDIALIEELLEYKKLGTLEEVEEAVGKQTAKSQERYLVYMEMLSMSVEIAEIANA